MIIPEAAAASRVRSSARLEVEVASEQPGRGRLGVDKLPRHAVTDRHAAAETDENQGEDGQPIQGRAPDPEPYEQGRQGGSGRSSRDRRRAASRAAGPTTDGAAGGTRDRSDDQAPGRTFDRTGPDDRGDDRSAAAIAPAMENAPAMTPRTVPHKTEDASLPIGRPPAA